MRISLVSLDIEWNEKEANRKKCNELISKSVHHKADLVIFPEMTLTGFNMNPSETGEDFDNSPTIIYFQDLAKQNNLAIVFGVVLKKGLDFFNCAVFVDQSGEIQKTYSKIHLFSHAQEDLHFKSGDSLEIISFKNLHIGLTVCYDLRFPELYSKLSAESDVIVNIANWPSKRERHWATLLEARAIENQRIIIGVNRTGKDLMGEEYSLSSKVVYPDGTTLEAEYIDERTAIYSIQIEEVRKYIKTFNTVNDRQQELYASWSPHAKTSSIESEIKE